jgi:hypothetical protein
MAQRKQSTAEIIELGKTIVKELGLYDSVDTLSRWMAHYLAELIVKAENASSVKEKSALEKECCEIILKLWKERENLSENLQPLGNLKETLEILNVFKKKEMSFFGMMDRNRSKGKWADFIGKINENSKEIIDISLLFTLANSSSPKSKTWHEKHSAMLTSEENKIIELLDALLSDYNTYFLSISGQQKVSIKDMKPDERIDYVFKKLKSLIEEQKTAFDNLMEAIKVKTTKKS